MDTKLDLVISRFVPLGFELMAIWIKVNKFSILYIVNKRHDITEHKNQQLTDRQTQDQKLYFSILLQIALSLQHISIKHINIKINVYFWQLGFQKGDNLNTNRAHPLYNLPKRVQILGHAHIICITVTTVIICCQLFCDLFINSAFERIFNVMQLILVKLSGILSKNI
jgi:hypothetical protein